MQGIFRKENTDKALKYGIYRHLPTYEKIIRNLVSFYTKKSANDIQNLKAAKLETKAKGLIDLIRENPYQTPPPHEKLQGDLQGAYSRRIYEVLEEEQTVKIISLWTHYEF